MRGNNVPLEFEDVRIDAPEHSDYKRGFWSEQDLCQFRAVRESQRMPYHPNMNGSKAVCLARLAIAARALVPATDSLFPAGSLLRRAPQPARTRTELKPGFILVVAQN